MKSSVLHCIGCLGIPRSGVGLLITFYCVLKPACSNASFQANTAFFYNRFKFCWCSIFYPPNNRFYWFQKFFSSGCFLPNSIGELNLSKVQQLCWFGYLLFHKITYPRIVKTRLKLLSGTAIKQCCNFTDTKRASVTLLLPLFRGADLS